MKPAVDPSVARKTIPPPLLDSLVALPTPLSVASRDLGVLVERAEDVVAGVRLGQEDGQVEARPLNKKVS